MGLFEWIGIGFFILILIVGTVVKVRTRRKIKNLNAFRGITKKGDMKGRIE